MKKWMKVLLILLTVASTLPIILTFGYSFRNGIEGYKSLFFDCFIYYRKFWNSVGYSAIITLVQLLLIVPTAFGLHMIRGKVSRLLVLTYVVLMLMPLQVTLLPNYIGLRELRLLNTPWAIILPQFFSPFGVVIMYQYMKGMDMAQVEACRLETQSLYQIFCVGILPQIKACIGAVAVFVFVNAWNMVEQPMLFVKDDKWKTLTIFMAEVEEYEGKLLFPAAVISLIPALLLYIFLHDDFETGLSIGELYEK